MCNWTLDGCYMHNLTSDGCYKHNLTSGGCYMHKSSFRGSLRGRQGYVNPVTCHAWC